MAGVWARISEMGKRDSRRTAMKILVAVDGSTHTRRLIDYLIAHPDWAAPTHHYTVVHCAGDCARDVPDGTYGGVSDGRSGPTAARPADPDQPTGYPPYGVDVEGLAGKLVGLELLAHLVPLKIMDGLAFC